MANKDKHTQDKHTQKDTRSTTINDLLSELSAAQQIGVFQNTPIESTSLLCESNRVESVPAILRMRRWVPFAAAAVLAITAFTWSTMFSWQLADLREAKARNNSGPLVVAATNGSSGFFDCLSGPKSTLSEQCKPYDIDNDGDVDMSDWAAGQQRSPSTRNR